MRTKFSSFKIKMNARKDKQDLCDEYESVAKLCLRRQSSGKYFVRDDDDKETIRINKRRRNQSRELLLDHLDKVCLQINHVIIYIIAKTSIRNITEEVDRDHMNFKIPSLDHFEESEHNLKPVHPSEEGLNPPRIGWYN
jgi:hypothetical protein